MGEEIECPVDPATLPPSDLRFQLGEETLNLLRTEFDIPKKWQQAIEEIGDVECGKTAIGHTAMEPARG